MKITHDWAQCPSCGWIGKIEDAVIPNMGGLLSCPPCSNLSVVEYHGPTTVEVPTDLLSNILIKLGIASIYLGQERFLDIAGPERECTQRVFEELHKLMTEKQLLMGMEAENV